MISAGSRRGSSHALVPWNREQAWSASGPSGGHAFSGRTDSNRLNTEQQIGHASVTRSRTLGPRHLGAARRDAEHHRSAALALAGPPTAAHMQARGLHATLLPPPRGNTRHSRRGRCGGMARLLRPHPRLHRHRRPARAESASAGLRDRRMRAERLAALRQGRRRLPQLLRKTMRTAPGGGELGGSQGRRQEGRHAEHRDDRRTRRTAHGQGGQRRRRFDQTPGDDRPTPAGGAPPLPLPEGLLQPDLPQRPRLSLRLLPRRVRRLLLRRRGQRPGGPTVLRRPRRPLAPTTLAPDLAARI